MNFDNMNYDYVGMRLATGQIKVVKGDNTLKGKVFESDSQFYTGCTHINESTGTQTTCIILDMING